MISHAALFARHRLTNGEYAPASSTLRYPSDDSAPVSAPALTDGLVEALDWLEQGILLVDSESHVLFASAVARVLLSACRGISLTQGVLRAHAPAQSAALKRLIAFCSRPNEGDELCASLPSCRIGEPPLSLSIAPLRRKLGLPGNQAGAIVFITDPGRLTLPTEKQLRDQFGLTAAESALAVHVMTGDGLAACAERLGISIATARTHLRRIFSKTGTGRQAELVRLLLSTRQPIREPQPSQSLCPRGGARAVTGHPGLASR